MICYKTSLGTCIWDLRVSAIKVFKQQSFTISLMRSLLCSRPVFLQTMMCTAFFLYCIARDTLWKKFFTTCCKTFITEVLQIFCGISQKRLLYSFLHCYFPSPTWVKVLTSGNTRDNRLPTAATTEWRGNILKVLWR